jgi:hypothetical protein
MGDELDDRWSLAACDLKAELTRETVLYLQDKGPLYA